MHRPPQEQPVGVRFGFTVQVRVEGSGFSLWGGLSQYRHPHEQPFCKRNAAHSRHGVGHFRPRLVALRLQGRISSRTHAVRWRGAVLVSVKATVCGGSGGCAGGFGCRVSSFTGDSHAGEMQWGTRVRRCRNAASRAPKSPRSDTCARAARVSRPRASPACSVCSASAATESPALRARARARQEG